MKKYLLVMGTSFIFFGNGCKNNSKADNIHTPNKIVSDTNIIESSTVASAAPTLKNPADFVPKGYALFEKINGDLNKDGLADCILIIKGTDSGNIVKDEYRGRLDRNRRGIIVLLNNKTGFELAAKNYNCFSSENEDGGVYYAPELSVEIIKGNLSVSYAHGRYGYWSYTFRYNNSDFDLIGYDASSNTGPVINSETSINFLTKRKQVRENTNENADSGEEVFKESWKNIKMNKLIKLSEIKDFDELQMEEL